MEKYLSEDNILFEGKNSLIYFLPESDYPFPIIVKVLKNDEPNIQQITHINNEYEMLQGTHIQGVRPVLAKIKIKNKPALALKYVEGEIARNIFEHIPFSIHSFLKIAIQICEILGNIHQNQIIHCDINSNNILINPLDLDVQIIDFGISSKIDIRNPELTPHMLQGTLAYISPEQTGRMNRSVDYRSDLYSLGVSFYEIISGKLPFQINDPMELIHAHIAKIPKAVNKLNTNIPKIIASIIAKLMEKNAENRYQSAFGVKHDLERCLHNLENRGKFSDFELAKEDFSGKLHIVEKLYGREAEVQELTNSLYKVCNIQKELLLISGYSGVGKSALVKEIHKYMPEQKSGNFITGKYEQFQRNVPYFAISKAFNSFCDYLITLKENDLSDWRQAIFQVIGSNGKILTEVIPNLEYIIGKQPEVAELNEQEAQNRFVILFQNFIHLISKRMIPFVLFLDDLQWADFASLNLLKSLMTYQKEMAFLLIGSYRDNEINQTHPLTLIINELYQENVAIKHIPLNNLQKNQSKQLLKETLQCENNADLQNLNELIHSKTLGNPFFTNELLKNIYETGLLKFDFKTKKWQWDIPSIQAQQISDNVVELMSHKITKLSPNSQEILRIASCIGNQFDMKTLMTIYENQDSTIFYWLWEAILAGLLLPLDEHYKLYQSKSTQEFELTQKLKTTFRFSHDRVQQAAYSMIEEDTRIKTHLKIARLLYQKSLANSFEENLFRIVHHFNLVEKLLEADHERQLVIQLNFQAGIKAKNSTAYQSAINYLRKGIDLLSKDSWQTNYSQTFEFYKECAISEFLVGNRQNSEDLFGITLQEAQSDFDKAQIYFLQAVQAQVQGKLNESIELTKQALQLLGIDVPNNDAELAEAFPIELGKVSALINHRSMDDLLNESLVSTETAILITKVLSLQGISAFLSGKQLLVGWLVIKMANQSLEKGHNEISSYAYTAFGFLACTALQDVEKGFLFGDLGIKLSHKFENLAYRAKTYHTYVSAIHFYKRHLREGIELERMAMKYGLESGEMQYTGFACFQIMQDSLMVGDNLDKILEESKTLIEVLQRVNPFILEFSVIPSVYQALLNLLGLTKSPYSFDNDDFSEKHFLQKFADAPNALSTFYMAKLRSLYWFEQYEEAWDLLDKYEMIATTLTGLIVIPETSFYICLTILANIEKRPQSEQMQYWEILTSHQTQMQVRATHSPENFSHKYLLVEAEKARLKKRNWEAVNYYEQAILEAQKAEYLNNEALANELFAKFWLQEQKIDYGELHFRRAYYLYNLWGAKAKVKYLEEKYSVYIKKNISYSASSLFSESFLNTNNATSSELDLYSVIKASQAISREVIVNNLLNKVLQIAIENAGAETGCLIDIRDGELFLMEKLEDEDKLLFKPVKQLDKIPLSIINYVKRTKHEIVLSNAVKDDKYNADLYIQKFRPKSILCFPVIRKGKISIILYLENNLTEDAFTIERLIILRTLSFQMAISIENALLYENLEEKVKERTEELFEKNAEIETQNELLSVLNKDLEGLVESRTEELQVMLDDLTKQNQDLEQFSYITSHNLRAPVAHILGLVSLFNKEDLQDSLNVKVIDYLKLAAENLDVIIKDLTEIISIRNNLDKKRDKFSISKVVENELFGFEAELNKANAQIHQDFSQIDKIFTIKSYFQSIIHNLVSNAIKYREVERNLKINIHTSIVNHTICLSVKDNGMGIDLKGLDLYNIFGLYKRMHSHVEGKGLGLYLVKTQIEAMNGKIEVESKLGKGSVFKVYLPY